MPRKELFSLDWPKGGLVEDTSFTEQPEGTTAACLNVRNYDALEERNRGGRRTGLVKVTDTQPNASQIQNITPIVEAVALEQEAGWGDKFAQPSTPLDNNVNGIAWHPDGDVVFLIGLNLTSTDKLVAFEWDATTGFGDKIDSRNLGSSDGLSVNSDGSLVAVHGGTNQIEVVAFDKTTGFSTAKINETPGTVSENIAFHPTDPTLLFVYYRDASGDDESFVEAWRIESDVSGFTVEDSLSFGDDSSIWSVLEASPLGDFVFTLGDGGVPVLTPFDSVSGFGTPILGVESVKAGSAAVSPDGKFVLYISTSSSSADILPWDETGFGTKASFTSDGIGDFKAVGWSKDSDFILAGGASSPYVKVFPFDGTVGTALADPASPPSGSIRVEAVAVHPQDDIIGFGGSDDDAHVYEFLPAQTNPSARIQRLAVVQQGNVYRSTPDLKTLALVNDGAGNLVSGRPVDASPLLQKLFFADGTADGYRYLDIASNTLKKWSDDVTDGSLPVSTVDSDLACRIVATYRSRVVLSGLKDDPQNWFMSKAGDPFDWDFSPSTTSQIQAVAGNNNNAGQLGDIVTALAPYNDDVMMMGGPNSLWIMRGDPAAGGAIDNISRQIGIVGPRAFAFDPGGNFFFFGENGLYVLAEGGGEPTLLSKNKIDKKLNDIDTEANQVFLTYDLRWQGIHIFIVPFSEPDPPRRHFFWDGRNNAWWEDEYPGNIGPAFATSFFPDNPDNGEVFVGGFDGWIRQFDADALSDDGVAIESFVRLSPINPGGVFATARLDDIHLITDSNSENVTFEMFSGNTVQQALINAANGTARYTQTLRPGRNTPIRRRIAQNAFIPQLSHNTATGTWAYESGGGTLSVLDRIRGKKVT